MVKKVLAQQNTSRIKIEKEWGLLKKTMRYAEMSSYSGFYNYATTLNDLTQLEYTIESGIVKEGGGE